MGEDSTEQPRANRAPDRASTDRPTVHVRRRLTVSEAAEELAISAEAVRSRVKRGTLRSTKEGGTVYVLLPCTQTSQGADQTTTEHDRTNAQTSPERNQANDQTEPRLDDQVELIESLREQVAYMREQLAEEREARRRADTIMAQLSQANAEQARTIRAIEATQEPRDELQTSETAAESTKGVETPADVAGSQEGVQRRSWWRRWFGIE